MTGWNFRNIRLIFAKEIRDILRDRRTLFVMVVLPILLYPVLMLAMSALTMSQAASIRSETMKIEIFGGENSERFVNFLEKINAEPATSSENASAPAGENALETRGKAAAANVSAGLNLDISISSEPVSDNALNLVRGKIRGKELRAAVVIPADFDRRIAENANASVTIIFDKSDERSDLAMQRVAFASRKFAEQILDERKTTWQLPEGFMKPVEVVEENVSTTEELTGRFLGPALAILLITMALTGAFYPAIDLSAGEKERGTMETLLICPASRGEIVMAKYLAVFVVSLTTAVLNIGAMAVTFSQLVNMIPQGTAKSAQQFSFEISPVAAVWMFLTLLPLAGFFSAICLAMSTFARSFKEAQNYLSPMFLVIMMLSMAAMLPGIGITAMTSFVPVLGTSLLLKALLVGDYQWYHILLVFAANMFYASVAISWATGLFSSEEVILRSSGEMDWKSYLRRRTERLPVRIEGVVLFLAVFALNFFIGMRMQLADPFWGTIGSFFLVFAGTPLIAATLLKLDVAKTFRLRPPSPADAVLAVVAGGAAIATGGAVVALQRLVFTEADISGESAKRLVEFMNTVKEMGPAALILLLAVTPAITEEILFRGFILRSFEHNWPLWKAAVASGFLFGFMHLNPYQFFYAAALGTAFAFLAVRTGSIWTAIIAHLIVNGASAYFFNAGYDNVPLPDWALYAGPPLLVLAVTLSGRLKKSDKNE
jgi:sodium transport system permease protein